MQNSSAEKDVSFVFCDYTNDYHCRRFTELINHYMVDPMGGVKPLSPGEQLHLLDGMLNHTSALVMFAVIDDEIVGLVTCFINFSTFKVKKYLYVHDIIVQKEYRGFGVGRKLMEKCIDIARERNYCKVTLEVRDDNSNAKALYKSLGFNDTEPMMHFWTKVL
ncbi:MAG TPA: GNAT family N-acetyltransferase [Bacteroidales bacterium]